MRIHTQAAQRAPQSGQVQAPEAGSWTTSSLVRQARSACRAWAPGFDIDGALRLQLFQRQFGCRSRAPASRTTRRSIRRSRAICPRNVSNRSRAASADWRGQARLPARRPSGIRRGSGCPTPRLHSRSSRTKPSFLASTARTFALAAASRYLPAASTTAPASASPRPSPSPARRSGPGPAAWRTG